MALLLNSPQARTKRPHLVVHSLPHQHPTTLRNFIIKFQDPSSDKSTDETASSTVGKKASSNSLGFGSSKNKRQQKGKRERDSIIRREPIQKPSFATQPDESGSKEFQKNESAFLLAWLGLGGIILVQGILLAASVLRKNGCQSTKWCSVYIPQVGLYVYIHVVISTSVVASRVFTGGMGQFFCEVSVSILYSDSFPVRGRNSCLWSVEVPAE
ncbi:hypothetical protein RND71_030069 [Anisodus tanguticus]|uniref:Uncharacterized protein n=1 Tax=Anisodus tanguticus TaxID=243964 RepID=A0AAE1V559_9SOLA|nr:hypothetical protein RND71_030069 [Anisodus tanguticus]